MTNIDLTKIKQLRAATDEKSANELIEKGWVLISVSSGSDESGYPLTRYSLAWFDETDPPSNF